MQWTRVHNFKPEGYGTIISSRHINIAMDVWTYTRAMLVAGPGAVAILGKGV